MSTTPIFGAKNPGTEQPARAAEAFTNSIPRHSRIGTPNRQGTCGLCIEIGAKAGEPLGLSFIGHGFDVRVGVLLNASLREALQKPAADCVAACPTAALSWAEQTAALHLSPR